MGHDEEPLSGADTQRLILIVEDEPLIRTMIADLFRETGFRVREAFNADEAMRILHSEASVDLVLSDVRMPGSMDGLELLAYSQATFPGLPFIITSGHCLAAEVLAKGAKQFLPKPYAFAYALMLVEGELAKLD